MNRQQQRVADYIRESFAPGAVTITPDGPESMTATDSSGESLVFWLDEKSGLVKDAHHWKRDYEEWRGGKRQ